MSQCADHVQQAQPVSNDSRSSSRKKVSCSFGKAALPAGRRAGRRASMQQVDRPRTAAPSEALAAPPTSDPLASPTWPSAKTESFPTSRYTSSPRPSGREEPSNRMLLDVVRTDGHRGCEGGWPLRGWVPPFAAPPRPAGSGAASTMHYDA